MPRWLKLEPAAVGAAAAATYVAVAMLYRAVIAHDGVIQPDLLVAAVYALYGLWTRRQVTPLALPRDNEGRPLTPPSPSASAPPAQPPTA